MSQADVKAAAAEAQGDIDTYAANALADRPPAARQAEPPRRAFADVAAASPQLDDATAAADVVRTYFALIEAGNFPRAYLLWEDRGAASGMSSRQFADGFARYATYRADVGAPGSVEAGAGQRYVEVPVRVRGELAEDQRPFQLAGTMTMHRTVIEGASQDQRAWRIRRASLQPRPDPSAGNRAECADETRVTARDDDRSQDVVWRRGGAARAARADRDDHGRADQAGDCAAH